MRSAFGERSVSPPVEIYSFDISQPRPKTISFNASEWDEILEDLTGSKLKKPRIKKKTRPDPPRIDNSFTIDTSSEQYCECPKCFDQIPLRRLRAHLSSDCSENIITCPEPGCGLRMPSDHLKEHLRRECPVVRKRRKLVKAAKQRQESTLTSNLQSSTSYDLFPASHDFPPLSPKLSTNVAPLEPIECDGETRALPCEEVVLEPTHTQCPQCEEFVPNKILAEHQTQFCSMRLVYCRNRSLGCLKEVPLRDMQMHIEEGCMPEKRKEELIARSKMRREVVQCSGCGEDVQLIDLKKHNAEECINRKVPCRNALLGCNVMVRLRDRKLHEHVDGKAVPKPCLYINGGYGHVSINEDDITPSWTMEFWIYRPSVLESAKNYLRECRRLCGLYHEAAIAEHNIKAQLTQCKQRLESVTEAMHADRRASRGHLLGQSEIGEITMMLANLVKLYEDTALICVTLAALLKVALNAALADVETLRILEDRNSESFISEVVKGTPCYHPPLEDDSTVGDSAAEDQLESNDRDVATQEDEKTQEEEEQVIEVSRTETLLESTLERTATSVTSVTASEEEVEETDDEKYEEIAEKEENKEVNEEEYEIPDEKSVNEEDEEVSPDNIASEVKVQEIDNQATESDLKSSTPREEAGPLLKGAASGEDVKTVQPDGSPKFPVLTLDTEFFSGEVVDIEALQATHTEECEGLTPQEEGDRVPEEIRKLRMNPLLFDWDTPKTWVRWRELVKDMLVKLAIDEEMLESWRYACGILKKVEEAPPEKSPKKKKERRGSHKRKIDASLRVQTRLESETKLQQKLIQGSDILAFSDDVYLSLCLDGTDAKGANLMGTIGFVDAKSGKRSFYTRIAREKWTHLCIVCSTTPFPSLLLYSDGLLVGAIKDTTYNLPMQSIGAPNLSFMGYILDARYWSRPRSTQEIRLDMYSLVQLLPIDESVTLCKRHASDTVSETTETTMTTVSDNVDKCVDNSQSAPTKSSYLSPTEPDMTNRNLVAWWPMEDGQKSTKVADVTEHRFASSIVGKYGDNFNWIEAETLLKDVEDALPIPSFREKSLCPYEVRRFRLAMRGRALYKSKHCPACNVKVKVHALRAHMKESCTKRLMTCRFDFCGASFPVSDQVLHESKYCAHIRKREAWLEQRMHDKATCPLCSIEVKLASLEHHMATKCSHRTVVCPNRGCNKRMSHVLLKDHVKFDCCSPEVKRRMWMIQQARQRQRYPRPWGIVMEYNDKDAEAAVEDSSSPVERANYRTTLDAEFKATIAEESDHETK